MRRSTAIISADVLPEPPNVANAFGSDCIATNFEAACEVLLTPDRYRCARIRRRCQAASSKRCRHAALSAHAPLSHAQVARYRRHLCALLDAGGSLPARVGAIRLFRWACALLMNESFPVFAVEGCRVMTALVHSGPGRAPLQSAFDALLAATGQRNDSKAASSSAAKAPPSGSGDQSTELRKRLFEQACKALSRAAIMPAGDSPVYFNLCCSAFAHLAGVSAFSIEQHGSIEKDEAFVAFLRRFAEMPVADGSDGVLEAAQKLAQNWLDFCIASAKHVQPVAGGEGSGRSGAPGGPGSSAAAKKKPSRASAAAAAVKQRKAPLLDPAQRAAAEAAAAAVAASLLAEEEEQAAAAAARSTARHAGRNAGGHQQRGQGKGAKGQAAASGSAVASPGPTAELPPSEQRREPEGGRIRRISSLDEAAAEADALQQVAPQPPPALRESAALLEAVRTSAGESAFAWESVPPQRRSLAARPAAANPASGVAASTALPRTGRSPAQTGAGVAASAGGSRPPPGAQPWAALAAPVHPAAARVPPAQTGVEDNPPLLTAGLDAWPELPRAAQAPARAPQHRSGAQQQQHRNRGETLTSAAAPLPPPIGPQPPQPPIPAMPAFLLPGYVAPPLPAPAVSAEHREAALETPPQLPSWLTAPQVASAAAAALGGVSLVIRPASPSQAPLPAAATRPAAASSSRGASGAAAGSGAVLVFPECVVCLERPRTHVNVPCGHIALCGPCVALLQGRASAPAQQAVASSSSAGRSTGGGPEAGAPAVMLCPTCRVPVVMVLRFHIP